MISERVDFQTKRTTKYWDIRKYLHASFPFLSVSSTFLSAFSMTDQRDAEEGRRPRGVLSCLETFTPNSQSAVCICSREVEVDSSPGHLGVSLHLEKWRLPSSHFISLHMFLKVRSVFLTVSHFTGGGALSDFPLYVFLIVWNRVCTSLFKLIKALTLRWDLLKNLLLILTWFVL